MSRRIIIVCKKRCAKASKGVEIENLIVDDACEEPAYKLGVRLKDERGSDEPIL